VANYDTYLDRLMAERGLENHELAAKAGTSRQAIYKLRRGLTRMLPDWAKRLAGPLGVSWQELVEGMPTSADQDRADLLAAYEAMDEEQRRALLAMAKVIVRQETAPERRKPPSRKRRAAACVVPLQGNAGHKT
jgi:transcriptional regulator with XRE-family HTH domain